MKIHTKISLLLAFITILLIALIFIFLNLRSREISLYLKTKLTSDEIIADKVLNFRSYGYMQPTRDNAAWDGMLEFTQSHDTAWAGVTLGSTRMTFDFDFFAVFDTLGNLLYDTRTPYPHKFTSDSSTILSWFENNRTVHHFTLGNNYIWEIFGCVIVPTADTGLSSKENGYLISAKCLDTNYIADLKAATGFDVALREQSDTDDQVSTAEAQTQFRRPLLDFDGKDIAGLEFTGHHPFMDEMANLKITGIILALACIFALIIFIFLINRWVASPLRAIARSIDEGELGPIEKFMQKPHGFGDIARLIRRYKGQTNDLIAEVKERSIAEEKFRTVFNDNPSALAILEYDTRVSMVNDAFCKASGYTREEILGTSWTDYIPDGDKQRMLEFNKKRQEDPQAAPAQYEFTFIHKSGEIRNGQISIGLIRHTGQTIVVVYFNT